MKICYAASSGGHLEELLLINQILSEYPDSFFITEKAGYDSVGENSRYYYIHQINRKQWSFPAWLIINSFREFMIFLKERPDVVISTGALSAIPVCLIAKLFRKKLIFIETFAVITRPSRTGKFLYRYADRFYVQWESLKKYYPDAILISGIY